MNIFEQRADDLIVTMQALYGNLFIASLQGLTLTQVKNVATGIITTLTDDQFSRGMGLLNAKAGQGGYCPTIAEFKTWCMSGSWWSVDEAWSRVCDHMTKPKVKLTTLAKYAYDKVAHQVTIGDLKGAQQQFKAVYVDLLSKAQLKGESQQWYEAPPSIATKMAEQGESMVAEAPKQKLGGDAEEIMTRTKELVSTGLAWPTAFKQAQLEVRGEIKPTFGEVA